MLVSKMLAPSLAKLLMHLCALSKPCSMLEDAHEVQLTSRCAPPCSLPLKHHTSRFPQGVTCRYEEGVAGGVLGWVLSPQALSAL